MNTGHLGNLLLKRKIKTVSPSYIVPLGSDLTGVDTPKRSSQMDKSPKSLGIALNIPLKGISDPKQEGGRKGRETFYTL